MRHHPHQKPAQGTPVPVVPAGLAPLGALAAVPGLAPPDPGNDEAPTGANGQGFEEQRRADKQDSDATSASPQALPTLHSKRQHRVLVALLTGPKTREQLDRIAGASNSPDVVLRLRRRFGLALPCRLGTVIDLDGRRVERGVYHLAATDRPKAEALTARGEA